MAEKTKKDGEAVRGRKKMALPGAGKATPQQGAAPQRKQTARAAKAKQTGKTPGGTKEKRPVEQKAVQAARGPVPCVPAPQEQVRNGPAAPVQSHPLAPIAQPLLAWYHANRRALPFRDDPTPYHVWVSEIMLQQTRVTAALPYYQRFTAALPNVAALAAAGEAQLHKLWQGLGYYSRVRNMQRAAKMVMERWGGQLPGNYEALLQLPGVGEYTAGAIASIAFGLPAVAVDGNVLRVFSRLLATTADITQPQTKRALAQEVKRQQPPEVPGDYNQALMELGALVCVPGKPLCGGCPLGALCQGRQAGIAEQLPVKPRKKAKTEVPVWVAVVYSGDRVLLHRRAAKGLLGGLWEPVLLEGVPTEPAAREALTALLPEVRITGRLLAAKHVFTHRVWQMQGWVCRLPAGSAPPGMDYTFATVQQLQTTYALPSAFKSFLPYLNAAKSGESSAEAAVGNKKDIK